MCFICFFTFFKTIFSHFILDLTEDPTVSFANPELVTIDKTLTADKDLLSNNRDDSNNVSN